MTTPVAPRWLELQMHNRHDTIQRLQIAGVHQALTVIPVVTEPEILMVDHIPYRVMAWPGNYASDADTGAN